MKNQIKYVIGDATEPQGKEGELKLIVHVCNDIGGWGSGFVLALSKKWKEPEASYRSKNEYILGMIDMIKVEDDTYVVNMIGQEGTISKPTSKLPPVRYVAIEGGLKRILQVIKMSKKKVSVHAPKFGSGLAGGNWNIIETIINETLIKGGVSVTIYEQP